MPLVRLLSALVALFIAVMIAEQVSAEPALISEIGSERATTGPGNNIVTHDGKTHVVWQDAEKPGKNGYVNRIRTLDRKSGKWSPPVTLGLGVDNHARPTIAIDSRGRLHVVLSGHNTPMIYRRSVRPNDATEWTKPESIDDGTYPMLVCGTDDVLIVASRPKTHSGVNLYLKKNDDAAWKPRPLILRRNAKYNGYAGYNVSLAWGTDGMLHLSADVFEGTGYSKNRGTHQSIVYMQSRDLGTSWTKADGTSLPEKIDPTEPDVLAEIDLGPKGPAQPARLRNGGVAVDTKNRPFVYFTEAENNIGRARLMTLGDKNQWQDLPLAEAFEKQWPAATVVGARGHLTIAEDAVHVLVEFSTKIPPGKTVERFSRNIGVGLLTSRDAGRTFEARDLFPLDPARHLSQVGFERQTGHNDLSGRLPSLIVTVGLQRYPNPDEVIQNKVFWLQP
jgi:hypothetical protein